MLLLRFFISAVLAFFVAKFTSGKKEGLRGRLPSVKFTFKRYTLWLHHWIFYFLGFVVLVALENREPIWYGICVGAIIQGLTYKDWWYIFFKTDSYPFNK